MNRFRPESDKSEALTHVVSYHGVVPLERGLCYVLYLLAKHWPAFEMHPDWILSASRDEKDIVAHNRAFGTNLHSQPFLIAAHARDPIHNAPANPVDQTSHCLRSDSNPIYRTLSGRRAEATERIAWYQRGIDWINNVVAAKACSRAGALGIEMQRPYQAGSERHHTVLAESPVGVLVARNVIHRH